MRKIYGYKMAGLGLIVAGASAFSWGACSVTKNSDCLGEYLSKSRETAYTGKNISEGEMAQIRAKSRNVENGFYFALFGGVAFALGAGAVYMQGRDSVKVHRSRGDMDSFYEGRVNTSRRECSGSKRVYRIK